VSEGIAAVVAFRGLLPKEKNVGSWQGAFMHVSLCSCRAVERGVAGTGEGVSAWLRGVWGLRALLTSSQVIRG
jgi:hypothetical protein